MFPVEARLMYWCSGSVTRASSSLRTGLLPGRGRSAPPRGRRSARPSAGAAQSRLIRPPAVEIGRPVGLDDRRIARACLLAHRVHQAIVEQLDENFELARFAEVGNAATARPFDYRRRLGWSSPRWMSTVVSPGFAIAGNACGELLRKWRARQAGRRRSCPEPEARMRGRNRRTPALRPGPASAVAPTRCGSLRASRFELGPGRRGVARVASTLEGFEIALEHAAGAGRVALVAELGRGLGADDRIGIPARHPELGSEQVELVGQIVLRGSARRR